VRRLVLTLLLAPTLVVLGVAAPASAAPTVVSFTVDGSADAEQTVAPSSDLEIAWEVTSTETPTVTAEGTGWTGDLDPSGSLTVSGPDAGETLTYTLSASDSTGDADDVTITVAAADEAQTPPPVEVDGCTVTVPASDSFDYVLTFEGEEVDGEALEPDTYDLGELTFDGFLEDVAIVAQPRPGVIVADGATTEFALPSGEDCRPRLFRLTTAPCSFTVENVSDQPIQFLYGDGFADRADGELTLAPGQERTVTTPRANLLAAGIALGDDPEEARVQTLGFAVPQGGCDGGATGNGPAWPFPTKAPGAGATAPQQDGLPAGWPVGLVVLAGLAMGVLRARATR
jgi:hypothetical protein